MTGDFYDGHHAILGGSQGQLAAITAGTFARKPHDGAVLAEVHAMQTVVPHYGWLAGDGGWIALTVDGGNTWRPTLGKLPDCAALFDFHTLAVRGGARAGSPARRAAASSRPRTPAGHGRWQRRALRFP